MTAAPAHLEQPVPREDVAYRLTE